MARLMYEQPLSGHKMLADAGLKNGAKQEIVLAVGMPRPGYIAFCSGVVRAGTILEPASEASAALPIEGAFVFENSEEVRRLVGGSAGILVCRAVVRIADAVYVWVYPESVQVVHCSDPNLRHEAGRPRVEDALKMLCA